MLSRYLFKYVLPKSVYLSTGQDPVIAVSRLQVEQDPWSELGAEKYPIRTPITKRKAATIAHGMRIFLVFGSTMMYPPAILKIT